MNCFGLRCTKTAEEPRNGLFRSFGATLWSWTGESRRRVRQNTGPQQFKASTAIHLTLDHFESVDLAFHLSSAPRVVHRRSHGGDVLLEAIGEADHRPKFAVFGSLDPLAHLR